MSKTFTIPAAQSVQAISLRMDNSSSTSTPVEANTGSTGVGSDDAILQALRATNTDSVDYLVQIFAQYGGSGNNMLLGTVKVPANSGNNGTVSTCDVLRALGALSAPGLQFDAFGNPTMKLPANTKILAMPTSTITSGKYVYLTGDVANF